MQAAQVSEYGDASKILVQEAATPIAREGQVLVTVVAASVNPFDLTLASGAMAGMIPLTLPYTIGGDFAGTMDDGRQVYGTALVANGGSGSMAEQTVANMKNISDKPKSIGFEEAASLPLAGCSALQAIEEHLDLQKGQKILIHGGAGGIGTLAIQLAKLRGGYVATTASAVDRDMLTGLGADLVIDYKAEDFTTLISEYDAVFDTVGGEVTNQSLQVLKTGGKLVTMIGEPDLKRAEELGIVVTRQNTGVTTERLERIALHIERGELKPVIDKVFPLEKSRDAYEYFVSGHPKGKVVLRINTN